MFCVKLVKEGRLDMNGIYDLVVSPNCGSVSIFIGTIRKYNTDGAIVKRLFYEAYEEMAVKMMEEICRDIMAKWPKVVNIVIHHKLGFVDVEECGVVIAVSSPHRPDSSQAVDFAITRLKETVPIFKKEECMREGETLFEWKGNSECPWS